MVKSMKVEQIAEICHEANRALCQQQNDYSQLPWASTPTLLRDSVIAGVKFQLSNPTATPADSHQSWCEYKQAEGWVWGETKNLTLKTHPNLRAYEQLPDNQKIKDSLSQGIVNACRVYAEAPVPKDSAPTEGSSAPTVADPSAPSLGSNDGTLVETDPKDGSTSEAPSSETAAETSSESTVSKVTE